MGKNSFEFRSENDLVQVIIRSGQKVRRGSSHRKTNVLSEFDTSVGRADVVFFYLQKNWRKNAGYAHLPSRWIYALRILPYRAKFSVEEFALMSGVSSKTATLALKRYESMGYCKKEKGGWIKIKQPKPVVKEIIAIEAKLTDWRRAIAQACRYQRYASQSWVVLDSSRANGAIAAKREFQRLNVGLKVYDANGKGKTLVVPRTLPPKSLLHFWEANGQIATTLCRPAVFSLSRS